MALRVQPGWVVGQRRGAGQGGVAVGGRPERGGAVGSRRPRVAEEGGAIKGQRAVAVLVAAVGVGRRDADGVVVHGDGQQSAGNRPVWGFAGVHLLELKQRYWVEVLPGGGGHAGVRGSLRPQR